MRNVFMKAIFGVALVALLTLASCAKQRNDAPDLSGELKALTKRVEVIEKALKADPTLAVKDVQLKEGAKNTLVVTMTDGKTHELVLEAASGSAGKDAAVWTINKETGKWQKDGKDTEFQAIGKDGKDGKNGKSGKYYLPKEDGFWYVVEYDEKGEAKEAVKTEQKWMLPGVVTAVFENGVLTLNNVQGAPEGKYVIGVQNINNLFFLPDNAGAASKHPLIILNPMMFGQKEFDADTNPDACPAPGAGKCDPFALAGRTILRYRVSPSTVTEAMIDKDNLKFLGQTTTLRGDEKPEFVAKFVSLKDGILSVEVQYDANALCGLYGAYAVNKGIRTLADQGAAGKDIQQLQLVVPTQSKSAEVFSDFVQVVRDDRDFNDYDLYYTPKRYQPIADKLSATLEDAKLTTAKSINIFVFKEPRKSA